MKNYFTLFAMVLCSIAVAQNRSMELGSVYEFGKNDANHPCITPEQYQLIEKQLAENRKTLGLDNTTQNKAMSASYGWPLQQASGVNNCSYYYIGAYVDEDTTSPGIKDWNCGTVTYDGHRGTDITSSPYPFYSMDNNQLNVVAAAPGTIVNKVDGNFDKNCAINSSTANYIIVQHADNSVALYWHMKKNSLTTKTIGQSVAAGEFLGQVGSSGDASGPHLHFEVWSGTTANTLKDPFSGPCNIFNASSLWTSQKSYREPAILRTQVNTIAPVFPACPATETPNEDTCFTAGANARFYIFIRNETNGMTANMSILNPGGSTFSSWTHNSTNTYTPTSYYYTVKTLPTTAGTYTFQAIYNGITCLKTFKINCGATVVITISGSKDPYGLYPNPAKTQFVLEASTLDDLNVELFEMNGRNVFSKRVRGKEAIDVSTLDNGVYSVVIRKDSEVAIKKLVILH